MRGECVPRLVTAGISEADAWALRRIAMTLRRWYEMECGDGNGYLERDEKTGIPRWFNARASYLDPRDPRAWHRIPDREAGAKKRLAKIMSGYPSLGIYVQTDPRGASLYILRPGDIPEGEPAESWYSRGIAIYE